MRHPDLPAETLMIGSWSSQCNNCGHDADPTEKAHIARLGYGDHDGRGCGVEWKYVYSVYCGSHAEGVVQQMRPDLEYVKLASESFSG